MNQAFSPTPPPTFFTLPKAAIELGISNADALARKLPIIGVQPDGVLDFGGRRMPIFSAARIADLRAALGGSV